MAEQEQVNMINSTIYHQASGVLRATYFVLPRLYQLPWTLNLGKGKHQYSPHYGYVVPECGAKTKQSIMAA